MDNTGGNWRWIIPVLTLVLGFYWGSDRVRSQIDDYPTSPGLYTTVAICSADSQYWGKGGAKRLSKQDDRTRAFEYADYGAFPEGDTPWRVASKCFTEGQEVGWRRLACLLNEAVEDGDRYTIIETNELGETYSILPTDILLHTPSGKFDLFLEEYVSSNPCTYPAELLE